MRVINNNNILYDLAIRVFVNIHEKTKYFIFQKCVRQNVIHNIHR